MSLILTLLGGPSPATREFAGGECRIGRGADNDWVLPDPDRLLSKRHCVLAFDGRDWRVTDLSTNGLFLNGEGEPIGVGGVRELRDGDRLRLGLYEMQVRIATPAEDVAELPEDSPFLPPAEPLFAGPVQPDHAPAIDAAFSPPRPAALLDDDWNADLALPSSTPPPVAPPRPVAVAAARDDLLAAFLRGAGLERMDVADSAATMEALGAGFRALVSGLRASLVARAAVKGEFRIAPTQVRPHGNNPLKFSADDDDALAALLGLGRRIDMAPARAIGEALDDMRRHELATVAAMQAAVRALLAEFAPAKFCGPEGASGLLGGQRKARAWDAFAARHASIAEALADDFDSVFGRAFARAYERALAEVAMPKGRG